MEPYLPDIEQAYVELLDDGLPTFRPVSVVEEENGHYTLLGPAPDGETWAVVPGSCVTLEQVLTPSGAWILVVREAAAAADNPPSR